MKNIHIIPTEKPSRLFYNVGGALLFTDYENYNGMNIYITSDEEIKEGDWFLTPTNDLRCAGIEWLITITQFIPKNAFKKIILTTDQDLIKDGVQAIDDEFLEWFVKNPSCEYVELKGYAIILPGESCDCDNRCSECEPKQETLEEVAEIYFPNCQQGDFISIPYRQREGFIVGAKWQAEQMFDIMQQYAAFCVKCDREKLPLLFAKEWFEKFNK